MSKNTEKSITQENTSSASLETLKDSKKKCNKKLWFIVSGIAVLVIAAIIIVAVLVSNKDDDDEIKKIVTTESIDQPTISTDNPTTITNKPTTPETNEPTTPVTNKPTTPETNEPTTPVTNKPTTPETNEPTTPVTNKPTTPVTNEPTTPVTNKPTTPETNEPDEVELQSEFEFNTQAGDLKEISVVQTSNDQSIFNSQTVSTKVTRKTNYQIYMLSEEPASEENKLFYSTMYTGAISIASECLSSGDEDCEPKEMVDLNKIKEDPDKIRILDEEVDLKGVPIAVCLFNITNNDFITSITCPDSLPDMKKHEILLDLYFYRSPAIERKDKEGDNITLTITKDEKLQRKFIRETNGGACKIENSMGSHCTTDMNITTDLKGNLLSYDELAISNIPYDSHNSFTKTKLSNLVDHSEGITKEDAENYKQSLMKLLEKLNPYMKEDVQFPREKFVELYDLINKDEEEETEGEEDDTKTIESSRRRLTSSDAIQYIKQKELFHVKELGIEVNLKKKINSGLNTDAMKTSLDVSFDEDVDNLYEKTQLSDMQKIITELKALSKAGNKIASELYDQLVDKLSNLPNEISIKLKELNDLLKFYDLLPVFNHTLYTISYNKLPSVIVELSNEVLNKLYTLYANIKVKDEVKENVENLEDNLYEYVNHSLGLLDDIFKNFKELEDVLLTKNNSFVEVFNYYSNHTSYSFYKMVENLKNLLKKYYIIIFNRSYPKIEELIKNFEAKSEEDLTEEQKYLFEMYTRLINGSYIIPTVGKEDFEKVVSNLINSYNYTTDIIIKMKEFIMEAVNIKDSGYYITNKEIEKNNEAYGAILDDAEKVYEILNQDGLIDKEFDRIMIKFKDSCIEILKYMADIKSQYFTLEENILNQTLFTFDIKENIEKTIANYTENILSKIKREVDYRKKAKQYIEQFIYEHGELNEIISDLEILLSEETLSSIVYEFELSLNESLTKLGKDIDKNVKLTEDYFNHFYNAMYNDGYLLNILQNYHLEDIPYFSYEHWRYYVNFSDQIYKKSRTSIYITKYNKFISTWDYTDRYLKSQLYAEVLVDYQNIFNNIKQMLESVINIEPLKNYTDEEDLEFYKSHVKIIEKLQSKVDAYFSNEIFESKYSSYVEIFINKYNVVVSNTNTFIKNRNRNIVALPNKVDYSHDFCIDFDRKICYGCTNCVWYTNTYDSLCLTLTPHHYNYLYMIKPYYEPVATKITFVAKLESLIGKINQRIVRYNELIVILQNELIKIKNEILDVNFDFSLDYLSTYAEWVSVQMKEKFGNVILKASYDYYHTQIERKFEELLKDFSDKWKDAFKVLARDVSLNYDKIKYTIYEFGIMGQIYQTILKTDLITNYFNSIVLFQKTEFNYTITHYYSYFYKLVNNSYTYVLSNLPKEENEYNDIIMERKTEILKYFELIFNNITESEKLAINIEHQKDILEVEEADFFKINSKIATTIEETDEYIEDRLDDLIDFELFHSGLEINQYALASRFYLENKEFGKLIEEIYKAIEEKRFFNLDLSKFKDIMIENWLVDSTNFINVLNDALYKTNKEIKNELDIKLESYTEEIEGEIKNFLGENIETAINEFYSANIKELTSSQIITITNAIHTNIANIRNYVKTGMNSITVANRYTFERIEQTIKDYKTYILQQINSSISYELDQFYENMKENVYEGCFEPRLSEYLRITKSETDKDNYDKFDLLNSSYKVGEIIYNLTSDTVEKFKTYTKKMIYFKYVAYHEKIKTALNYTGIESFINDEFDDIYSTEILSVLNSKNEISSSSVYVKYDLKVTEKQQLNSSIALISNTIRREMSSTKGANFAAHYDCPSISRTSVLNISSTITESFKDLLIIEKEDQGTKINEYIENVIISNLDDFLENVIPTFGNEFFDRIIDYNINFKILDLYDNLQYALGQIFLYYSALGKYRDNVEELPVDLKYRLYRLNYLNYTIVSQKEDIIELLEEKLNILIANLSTVVREKYTYYFEENSVIQDSFDAPILQAIKDNLENLMPKIELQYNNALKKYLKDKFVDAFTNILNEKTDDMLKRFNEEKERLIKELDTLFTSTEDKDLHEVNRNFHETFISIREFFKYVKTFTISEDIEIFFNTYANLTIVPVIVEFREDLNRKTYELVQETINNNSKEIESIDIKQFYNLAHELMDYFTDNFFQPIIDALNYCKNPDYKTLLLEEKNKFMNDYDRRRRLADEADGEAKLEKNSLDSENVEEIFDEIVQIATNAKNYNDHCPQYFFLSQKLDRYISINNLEYKTIRSWIIVNRYSKDIHLFLINKLYKLYSIIDAHYANAKVGFLDLRSHLKTNIDSIYDKVILCRNTTATTLNQEYQIILDKTDNFTNVYTYDNDIEEKYDHKHATEHMINYASATISGLKEYSEFVYEVFLEGNLFKFPKVNAKIVDKTRPDRMVFNIRSEYGFCGRTSYLYNVKFNEVNYTMTIVYEGRTNIINVTTYTNFDAYNYTSRMYQVPDSYEMDNITYMGYTIHFYKSCYDKDNRTLSDLFINEVEAKHYNESMIIVG